MSQKRRPRPRGEGLMQGSRKGQALWLELPHDPGGPPLQRDWTLPLGISSAPEMGASKLKSDLIHNICGADTKCQLGPMAWPGDVSAQPDSLTRQPSPIAAASPPLPPWAGATQCPAVATGLALPHSATTLSVRK